VMIFIASGVLFIIISPNRNRRLKNVDTKTIERMNYNNKQNRGRVSIIPWVSL
jgi:hypothetical protein